VKIVAIAVLALASFVAHAQSQRPLSLVVPASQSASVVKFTPPNFDTVPDTPLGTMIRYGRDVFVNTQRYGQPYVGNKLNCVNCHLDAGRLANAAPLWAAYVSYPAFRAKNEQVDTFERRLEDCFRFSMNGRMPPGDSLVITSLVSYSYWLATGAPVGAQLAGRGFPEVPQPPLPASVDRGQAVYTTHCAACHQPDGKGLKDTFPPVWGSESYNKGAGMHRIHTAAAFIKANMPMGQGGTLSDQESWDVAAFINSKPRPPDPRDRKP
jgi:thiosulfate dehydrogenase